MVWSNFDLGWPWMCLGGAVALFAVAFGTNAMRGRPDGSRWWDPVWLAWLAVPMLMVHMFEEYGFDMLGRTYLLPETLCTKLGYPSYPNCPIPIAHYPLVNLGIAWVTAPLAAWFSRRNLIIGLSWYGLLIFNGLLHVVMTIAGGLESGSGVLTGALLFIPSFFWMVYVCLKSGVLSWKALAVSVSGGIIAHMFLAVTYGLFTRGVVGPTGMLALDVLTLFLPILVAGAGSRLVRAPSAPPLATTPA